MSSPQKLFKFKYALSHGIMPAGMFGILADLGSPVGLHWAGWVVSALYVSAIVVFASSEKARSVIYDLACPPDGAKEPPFLFNPFAWALVSGALVSFAAGTASYLSRKEGGFIASNAEFVRELQKTNMLLSESLEVQKRIAVSVDGVKRETSDNPSKELANLGFEMSPIGIRSAIELRSVAALRLFAQAGARISSSAFGLLPGTQHIASPIWNIVEKGDNELAGLLAPLGTAEDPKLCFTSEGFGDRVSSILVSREQRSAYRIMCKDGAAEAELMAQVSVRKQQRSRHVSEFPSCKRKVLAELLSYNLAKYDSTAGQKFIEKSLAVPAQPYSLLEALAHAASAGSPERGPISFGGTTTVLVAQSDRDRYSTFVCDVLLDPTHASRSFVAKDEDLEAMKLALAEGE